MSRGLAVAVMVMATVLFSSGGVVFRHVEGAGALEMVFWRSLFAFLFVFVFLQARGKDTPLASLRAAGWPGLVSAAMWALSFTAFVVALSLTTVANTLLLSSIGSLVTVFLARLVLREPVPLRTWLATAAAAAGIAWMFHDGLSAGEPRHVAGMLVALIVALCGAVNIVILRATAARLDLMPAVMLGGALACVLTLPFALPFSASARDLSLLALLGLFQIGVPCMLVVMVSRTLLAPEIALLWLLETVLGPLWAWLGAGEAPHAASLSGGAVVLAALAANELAALGARRRSAVPG
jgi:drug/metabolite transporter (DMT)-like permease